jgi:hypothetical protein
VTDSISSGCITAQLQRSRDRRLRVVFGQKHLRLDCVTLNLPLGSLSSLEIE